MFEKKSVLFRLSHKLPFILNVRIDMITLNQSVSVFFLFFLVISAVGNLVLVLYQDFVSKVT